MPTAKFYNFSNYPFTGRWGGEDENFAPKEERFMPAFLAQHFAKHLVNRELHRMGLDAATSPKNPEDQPEFEKLFRIAYTRDRDLKGSGKSNLRSMIDSVHLNRTAGKAGTDTPPPPNVLGPDVEPKPQPRQPAPEEDPNFTRENMGGPVGDDAHTSTPGGNKGPQIVVPPDFDDDEESGYEGVKVEQEKAPETSASSIPSTTVTS